MLALTSLRSEFFPSRVGVRAEEAELQAGTWPGSVRSAVYYQGVRTAGVVLGGVNDSVAVRAMPFLYEDGFSYLL